MSVEIALQSLRPGAIWQIAWDDPKWALKWLDPSPQPSMAEIEAEIERLTLESVKVAKVEAVKARLASETAALVWNGNTYQTDVIAKERFAAEEQAIARDDRPNPSSWRTLDNKLVPLSNADIQALITAIYQRHRQAIFASFTHKDAIATLTTVAAVEVYDISTGWPNGE